MIGLEVEKDRENRPQECIESGRAVCTGHTNTATPAR